MGGLPEILPGFAFNSLFAAERMVRARGRVEALPVDEVVKLYRRVGCSAPRP